jgi:hypothetical protein
MVQDPEAVYLLYLEAWVEWDALVREDLVQRAAKRCVTCILRPKRGRTGVEASPPTLPLTAAWMLLANQGRSTLCQVLGKMHISTAKKQVLQSIAGAFPGNAVLHKAHNILAGLYPMWSPGRDAEPNPMPVSCAQGGKNPSPPKHSKAAVARYNGCCQRMGRLYGTDCGWSLRPAATSGTNG